MSLVLIMQHDMETCGKEVMIHSFLALDWGEWSPLCPIHTLPGDIAPSIYWIGGWMGPSSKLDMVAKRKSCCSYQEENLSLLDLSTRWGECSVSHPSCALPQYPLDRRLGGPRSTEEATEKNSLPLPGIEPWSSSLQSDTTSINSTQLAETSHT
jgi:hypothetical protein